MSTEVKKYALFSSDKECFEVDESVAKMSQTLKNIIDDGCADNGIPLPIITGRTLAKVIEYCKKHVQSPNIDGDLMAWDSDFLKVDQEMLFNLILASNYLNIKGLLDLTCQTVADMMKDMSAKDVRTAFNIKADLTVEEETEYGEENAWAFK